MNDITSCTEHAVYTTSLTSNYEVYKSAWWSLIESGFTPLDFFPSRVTGGVDKAYIQMGIGETNTNAWGFNCKGDLGASAAN